MWTDVSAVKVKDDVYTLIANLRQVGFDDKYKWTYWGTLSFSLADFALYGFSIMPFWGKYWLEYDNAHPVFDEFPYYSEELDADECSGDYTPTYDEFGCDQCSRDIDGV